ncbi:MAG: putative lipid II flippase FtsW [Bdellovibrionales bacterium]|nr:putative lipid II flippase FtsW [Bdellovibrionales bacterium]
MRPRSGSKPKFNLGVEALLLVCCVALLGISVLMVLSTTAPLSDQLHSDGLMFAKRHVLNIIAGVVVMFAVVRAQPRFLLQLGPFILLCSVLMLVLVLVPSLGVKAGGAQRWLSLGPVRVQPGEFVKLGIVLYIASYVGRQEERLSTLAGGLAIPFGIVGAVVLLLLLQPDFGTSAVIGLIVFAQLLVSGARLTHLFGAALLGGSAAWLMIQSSAYRLRRIQAFLDPFDDPSNTGYQLIQSLIAVGSGGVSGAGLGAGQQKLFYLPAAHTDFIFAVIGEELGLIGCTATLLIFAVIAFAGLTISMRLRDSSELSALAVGLTLLLTLPAFLNMMVVTGLLPTKGLVLPLVGYGGSAMVANLIALGLLIRLAKVPIKP